jgi:hypothetical protein
VAVAVTHNNKRLCESSSTRAVKHRRRSVCVWSGACRRSCAAPCTAAACRPPARPTRPHLEARALSGARLLLHGHDLHHLVLQRATQEVLNDLCAPGCAQDGGEVGTGKSGSAVELKCGQPPHCCAASVLLRPGPAHAPGTP